MSVPIMPALMNRMRRQHRKAGVNKRFREKAELAEYLRERADVVIEDYAPANEPLVALHRFNQERRWEGEKSEQV